MSLLLVLPTLTPEQSAEVKAGMKPLFLLRHSSLKFDKNGNMAKSLFFVDETGYPVLSIIPGRSSCSHGLKRGWYLVEFSRRLPAKPFDSVVSSLEYVGESI